MKTKDFISSEVVSINNKKIGFIKDVLVDFNSGFIKGVVVSSYKLLNNSSNIFCEQIISYNWKIVADQNLEHENCAFIPFSMVKGMDVTDKCGKIIGIVEDIIFDSSSYKIKGIILSIGLVRNLIYGKKIILNDQLSLGEESAFYYGNDFRISFESMPHKLFVEAGCYEKSI